MIVISIYPSLFFVLYLQITFCKRLSLSSTIVNQRFFEFEFHWTESEWKNILFREKQYLILGLVIYDGRRRRDNWLHKITEERVWQRFISKQNRWIGLCSWYQWLAVQWLSYFIQSLVEFIYSWVTILLVCRGKTDMINPLVYLKLCICLFTAITKWKGLGACIVPSDSVEDRTMEYALSWILSNYENKSTFPRIGFLLDWLTGKVPC